MSNTRRYRVEKELYEYFIMPKLTNVRLNPKTLIQFGIPLPFYLPFPQWNGLRINDDKFLIFHFNHVDYNIPILNGFFEEDYIIDELVVSKTIVEANLFYIKDLKEELVKSGDKLFQQELDEVIRHINDLVNGYKSITGGFDADIFPINKHKLTFALPIRFIDLPDFNIRVDKRLSINPLLFPDERKDVISSEKFKLVQIAAKKQRLNYSPFDDSFNLFEKANVAYKNGDFSEAIILAQTFIEHFLATAYRYIKIEEGEVPDTINSYIEVEIRKGIKKFTVEKFKPIIGGNWNPKGNSPVSKWLKHTTQVRNKIIHGGYFPGEKEAFKALATSNEMMIFVAKRIRIHKDRYPNLNSYFAFRNELDDDGQKI